MIKKILFGSKDKMKSAYLWNTCAAMLNAFQTVFILMLISRIDPVIDAGVFTIAFAIGNLMMAIGKYGIRQFQVSDVEEKYSFKEYTVARIITSIIMIAASFVYVGVNLASGLYDSSKSIVIILICLAKVIDAVEDVPAISSPGCGRKDPVYQNVYLYFCILSMLLFQQKPYPDICSGFTCIIYSIRDIELYGNKRI